jgi:predicted extracellular nuclease
MFSIKIIYTVGRKKPCHLLKAQNSGNYVNGNKKKEESDMKHFALISLMILSFGLAFALTCYEVQYAEPGANNSYPSPLAGQTVTVSGIVTEDTFNTSNTNQDAKFFISDPSGGPWSGLYIFKWGTGVAIGDLVNVTGPVVEYFTITEISGASTTVSIISHGNQLPEPALIPTVACAYPSDPAISEQWENCYVKFENITVTDAPGTNRFFKVDDGSGVGEISNYGLYPWSPSWNGPAITVGETFGRVTGIVESYYSSTSSIYSYALCPRNNDDLQTTAVQDNYVVAPDAELLGNYPNPFAGSSVIAFNLKSTQPVQIQVFNLKGQKVRTLVDSRMGAQLHNVTFDGRADNGSILPSGLYMYKMTAGNTVQTRKLVIR